MTTYAWRAWRLVDTKDGPALANPERGDTILTRRVEAVCPYGFAHEVPAPGCTCGIHVMPTQEALWQFGRYFAFDVVTRVELHGPVQPGIEQRLHPGELRARAVTIVGPGEVPATTTPETLAALAERYGCEFTPSLNLRLSPMLTREADRARIENRLQAALSSIHTALYGAEDTCPAKPAGLVLMHADTVLLQMRGRTVDHPLKWAFPGGLPNGDESPTDTALREAFEEHGSLRALHPTVVGVVEKPGYTYVLATPQEPPPIEEVASTSVEAVVAAWVPIDAVHKFNLHPALAEDWPLLRERLTAEVPA